jgi:hypothetical protein
VVAFDAAKHAVARPERMRRSGSADLGVGGLSGGDWVKVVWSFGLMARNVRIRGGGGRRTLSIASFIRLRNASTSSSVSSSFSCSSAMAVWIAAATLSMRAILAAGLRSRWPHLIDEHRRFYCLGGVVLRGLNGAVLVHTDVACVIVKVRPSVARSCLISDYRATRQNSLVRSTILI